jgi:hypothetical protein
VSTVAGRVLAGLPDPVTDLTQLNLRLSDLIASVDRLSA